MSLIFMDGFDHYATGDLLKKWTSTSSIAISSSYARFSGQGIVMNYNDDSWKELGTDNGTLIFGAAVYLAGTATPVTSSGQNMISFWDGTTKQLYVNANSDWTISVFHGGSNTALATSTRTIESQTWYYVEVKVTVHDSAGAVELRIGGESWCSATGIDTKNSGNAYINKFGIGQLYNIPLYYDDLYICDGQGSVNNDFLGDVRIATILPDSAGTHTDFTPSAGANYENVDDATDIDDDSTYNSSGTATDKDSYNLAASPTDIDTVYGIQVNTTMRKDDAGTKTAKPFVRSNATDYGQGSAVNLPDSYVSTRNIVELNPADSAAWEKADLDALEIGLEIIS